MPFEARDSTGLLWFANEYEGSVDEFAYDRSDEDELTEPFQDIYNRVANDLVLVRDQLLPEQLRQVRQVAGMRFAADLALRNR